MKTIVEGLHAYFNACPLLADGKLNIGFLRERGIEYSIDLVPAEDIIKRYVRGAAQCQCVFAIRSVRPFGQEVLQQLDNCGFFEGLSTWIRTKNHAKEFPVLPDGCTAEKLEIQSTAYLAEMDTDSARYQIQCRLIYYRKGV